MDYLRIGDYITLRNLKFDGFMFADGILQETFSIDESSHIHAFEEALFCIHYPRQYSAARELEEFNEANLAGAYDNLDDDSAKKYLTALTRGRDNENKLNDTYMTQKMGTPVLFGDLVQLLHVKSGKFVTVIPDKLASHERENMVVTLNETGNIYSWLKIQPRYKIDREGDKILSGNEVLLKVSERPNEYIHCSERQPPPGTLREINCSLETSAWKVSVFQTVKDGSDQNLILATNLVLIHDPETRSNLSVIEEMDEEGSVSHTLAIIPAHSSGDSDSMALWVIETKNLISGGPIQWKTDFVRFRNLNTGKYLIMKSDRSGQATGRSSPAPFDPTRKSQYELALSSTPYVSNSLFNLHEMYGTSLFLANAKAMQLCSQGVYVERGEYVDATGVYGTSGVKDKSKAVSLLMRKYSQVLKRNEVEIGEVINRSTEYVGLIEESLDVFVGVSARRYLSFYMDQMMIPSHDFTQGTFWPKYPSSLFLEFVGVLKKLHYFVKGLKIATDPKLQFLEHQPIRLNFRRARQGFLLEQGVLATILHLLEILHPLAERNEMIPIGSKQFLVKTDSEKSILRMCDTLVSQSLALLFSCIESNPKTQIFVADSLPVLLAYVASHESAARCVTEMLSTNMELQETKISEREINIFTNKLRASKMNSMYLNLLKACCSCMGKPIDGNQGIVAEVLFDDVSDIIIQIHQDLSKTTKVNWDNNGNSLFVNSSNEPGSPMLGQELVDHGYPQLSLSWTTKSIDYSPLGLFGKLSVNIQDLYPGKMGNDNEEWLVTRRQQTKGSAAQTQKQAVADYFVAELYLAAEMCLGRNYVAMQKLESFFQYNTLVAIMKMNVMTTLKSAATRLMLCLYVDREPQIASTVPCLTRAWSETIKSGIPQLPYVEVTRKNQFALLQQLISEHIREMAGNRWEDLSVSMMLLLKHLIMFNFYGTKEKLQDVIEPLITAIDRRKVPIPSNLNDTTYDNSQSLMGKKRRRKFSKKSISKNFGETSLEESLKIEEGKDHSRTIGEGGGGGVSLSHKEDSEHPVLDNKSWQSAALNVLESLPFMSFIIFLVFAAISVAIYVAASGSHDPSFKIFDIVITAIFCCEVSFRFYCFSHVKKDSYSFFKNTLNVIDILVCVIDLVILGIPSAAGSGASFIKVLRVARLIRLVRVIRAAKIMQKLKDLAIKVYDPWKMPLRYLKTPKHELETVVAAMNILSYIQHIIEDRYLSLLLQGFHDWQSGVDPRTPGEIFEEVIVNSKEFSLGCASFDDVFIDTIMFSHVELVQVALDVLMAHHSSRGVLFDNAKKLQLLASPQRERQLKTVRNMLNELARNAETHELWGGLTTEDDLRINKQTFEHMSELIQMCRTRCKFLDFDEDYTPDQEVQNMLRNLGFFTVALKVLGLLPSISSITPEEENESSENTRNLIRTCNDLLYWFFNDNASNQQLGFDELLFFLTSLDMGINSHRTIHAIFKNNESLMRSCPRELIEEYSERVCKLGRRPQYLAILGSVTHVREKNILENQYEIVKHLMAPGRMKKMIRYCVDKTNPEYQERADLMKPYLNKGDVTLNDLPSELAYHIEILRVLAGCTVGRINITTVEAKVQSVYSYKGMLEALLDSGTLYLVKTRVGLLFFNAMIEVEILVGGLAIDPLVWQFISESKVVFSQVTGQLKSIEENGWESSGASRQFVEYAIVCAMILSGYFVKYFDLANFETFAREDKPTITMEEVQNTITAVFEKLYVIHELKCKCLTIIQKMYISQALDSMRRYSPTLTSQYPDIEIIYPNQYMNQEEEEEEGGDDEEEKSGQAENQDKGIELLLNQPEESTDMIICRKFTEFIHLLETDERLLKSIEKENNPFVEYISALPFVADNVQSDVRYEALIKKLVMHVRDRLETVPTEKRLDARCTQTTIWIIRSFRTMIENKWGMSIDERDEHGGEEEDNASAPIVQALNSCGATALCLDLISVGIDSSLMLECVRLCVAMLYKEGGNLPVQQTIYNYLKNTKSDLFFQQLHKSFQTLISWHKWHDIVILKDDQEVNLPDDVILVRFLQLLCEGHYQPNQDIMREQTSNTTSINLLDDYVGYLNCLSRLPCRTSTEAAIKIAATILEVIQGPCEANQEHFVLQTELIETLNRIIRAKTTRDCREEAEVELKKTAIDILQGLLEGQGGNAVVYDRVLSVVHLDAIQMMCYPDRGPVNPEEEEEEVAEDSDVVILRVECLVLLQMFCDYRPSLREELELDSKKLNAGGTSVASVEILWRGELQRRFFHLPAICTDLAKASKDALVEYVDRKNQESKLLDFLTRSRELYREIKHQQVLKEYKLSGVFSRSNQDRATWISLFLAVIINAILVIFFRLENGQPYLNNSVQVVVNVLNIIQIAFSSFTLILFLVVRVPVQYQSNRAKGMDQIRTILHTCSDPMTVYYFFYLLCSIMGYNVSYLFLTVLLLDILVKNATARDILMAVVYPRKQLALAYLLLLFVVYIFAFIMFYYFRNEFIESPSFNQCHTLFTCYKLCLGNALRSDGGIGDFMEISLGTRYLVDTCYFVVVIVILLNVIFGIVIDTFGNLRTEKADRQADTTGTCFICGIDKQVFDRASDGVQGFSVHIKSDHNMWNYLFFIIYIWEQDKDDDDGLEQFVRRSIEVNDINWFPMNRAMRLNVEESEEEQLLKEIHEDIDVTQNKMTTKLTLFQAEIASALEEINRHLTTMDASQETSGVGGGSGGVFDSPTKEHGNGHSNGSPNYDDNQSEGSDKNMKKKRKTSSSYGHHGGSLEDEDSVQSHSNLNQVNPNKFKQLQLRVLDIQGLNLPDLETAISLRIIADSGMSSINSITCTNDKVIFADELVTLSERASIDDNHTVRIQILQGTGRIAKFISIVEISYEVLIGSTELVYEKVFTQPENPKSCILSLYPIANSLENTPDESM